MRSRSRIIPGSFWASKPGAGRSKQQKDPDSNKEEGEDWYPELSSKSTYILWPTCVPSHVIIEYPIYITHNVYNIYKHT